MACGYLETDWKAIKAKREAYRVALIAKGIADGTSKMREMLARKGW